VRDTGIEPIFQNQLYEKLGERAGAGRARRGLSPGRGTPHPWWLRCPFIGTRCCPFVVCSAFAATAVAVAVELCLVVRAVLGDMAPALAFASLSHHTGRPSIQGLPALSI
jgi:hypothetical protein